jgi:hypothetical protein
LIYFRANEVEGRELIEESKHGKQPTTLPRTK